MPNLEIHYDTVGGEWAALYVDGNLNTVGDSYLAEEWALELCGVTIVQDPAFMRGQTAASGVAQTLADVAAYARDREARQADADRLRAEAARLLAEANTLDGPAVAL
jgi:hypothetical protein